VSALRERVAAAAGSLPRWRWGPVELPALALVVAAAFAVSWWAGPSGALKYTTWTLYGLLALSLVLVWGKGAIFSFGQAALFGVGGYVYGIAAINLLPHTGETLSAVAIAVVASALFAGIVGWFMFYGNLGEVYVAIVTLALSLVMLILIGSTSDPKYHVGDAVIGGYNGLIGVPALTLPGSDRVPLEPSALLVACVLVAGTVAVALHWMMRRPFGRVVTALAENELRTELLGYDTRRTKLIVFMIGGAIAGLAGAGYAASNLFINPTVFGLQQAALVVIWALIGGRSALTGAFVGVVLIEAITSQLGGSAGDWTPIVLGVLLIGAVLVLPQGVVPAAGGLWRRLTAGARSAPAGAPGAPAFAGLPAAARAVDGAGPPELAVEALGKRFGGLVAVDDVDLTFAPRGVHCLVGPNGAGKSTFFNLLVGIERPSDGRIRLGGRTISRRQPHSRARAGLGIKRQVASVYPEASVFDNVWIAAYADARSARAADERAAEILDWLALADHADVPASALAHGHKQLLEIGMVLAARPAVVLLDEPTAGMTAEETSRIAELVTALGDHCTVIVVDHDMGFVRQLEAPVIVFHRGKVFARGSIDELRSDERVLDIYLGRAAHAEA
jgi:branched-chain amino acid transport system permease protein